MGESTIVCKPTPWFLIRAAAMLLMFGVFSVLFYIDGSTGYRKKNLGFHMHATFKQAHDEFARMNSGGALTAEEWRKYAEKQVVRLPEDRSVLPADLELPVPWPEVLHDYEKMKPLDWHRLWLGYSAEREMASSPPERPYDARKIQEQWVVFWICLALSLGAAFFLVRTLGRSLKADDDAVTGVDGKVVPYRDMKRLDLRKWETKGLAFIEFEGGSGKGRVRIDGLTYGGFKKEQDEPAERLMRKIRSRFSGEILEYVSISAGDEGGKDADQDEAGPGDRP
jgi:hypothetical protein